MIARKIVEEAGFYLEAIVMGWPGYAGNNLRTWYLRRRLAVLGGPLTIDAGCVIHGAENIRIGGMFHLGRGSVMAAHGGGSIEIGQRVALNTNVHINASIGGRIVIGRDVLIGPNTVMRATDHRFDRTDIPIFTQGHVAGEIIIEDDVWIGAQVTVVKNVRIGRGAVIGAGAVVTQDIPPYAVAVGVPARPIKYRLPSETGDGLKNT